MARFNGDFAIKCLICSYPTHSHATGGINRRLWKEKYTKGGRIRRNQNLVPEHFLHPSGSVKMDRGLNIKLMKFACVLDHVNDISASHNLDISKGKRSLAISEATVHGRITGVSRITHPLIPQALKGQRIRPHSFLHFQRREITQISQWAEIMSQPGTVGHTS